jgi:hypothetical protein
MKAARAGARTWMLVSDSGQCQPLKYLRKNRESAPNMRARIRDVDENGPSPNQELAVNAAMDEFFEEGEKYDESD